MNSPSNPRSSLQPSPAAPAAAGAGVRSSGPVFIGADHAGASLKREIQQRFPAVQWVDLGPDDDERVDYPDFAEKVARQVVSRPGALGVLICGSGIGMCIAANKIAGVRAAAVENPAAARLSREHNDANVLCLGARLLAPEYAAEIVRAWIETPFSGEPRHRDRIAKIADLEKRK